MQQNAAFHQGLHCCLGQNISSDEEIQYILEIITCDPSKNTVDQLVLVQIVIIPLENSIVLKRFKIWLYTYVMSIVIPCAGA